MDNYHIILQSLHEIHYVDIISYIKDELKLSFDEIYFYKEMLLNDLPQDYMLSHLLNDNKTEIFATEENINATNKILHSYFINKLFPYVGIEDDIDIHYDVIVDPKHIDSSYFRPNTMGTINMVFHICFSTRDCYNRFKLKYPKEKEQLNLFNRTTYKFI